MISPPPTTLHTRRMLLLLGLLIVLFIADVALGSMAINPFGELGGVERQILWNYRLPKAITALLCGAGLSLCGVVMQTIFRNPLAGPYVLGVSSGGSLGVAFFMLGGAATAFLGDLGAAGFAFLGSMSVMFLVLMVSVRLRDIMAVLILGMMLGSAVGAVVDVLQFFSSEVSLKGFVVWAMGSVGGVSWPQILLMFLALLVGVGLILSRLKSLDASVLGEVYARSLGVSIGRSRLILFTATSLIAGVVTAFCGPIAFVGIAVPHLSRMLFCSSSHRILLLSSALLGGCVMLFCDLVSSLPFSDAVLPLNTITALFGIPIVVLVVVRAGRGRIM